MKRGALLAGLVALAIQPGAPLLAQTLPERQPVGSLQLVASFPGDQPAGVAVSRLGRLFVSFPRHYGAVAITVGEVRDGRTVAFPDAAANQAAPERPAETLFSVQAMIVDASDRLWLLDSGLMRDGEAPVPGAPKLVVLDLARNEAVRTIPIPPAALARNSALKDVRIDRAHGTAGTAYITDSAPGAEAFIVLDLTSGTAVRRLQGAPALGGLPGAIPVVGRQPLLTWPVHGPPQPFSVGLNGLELSADSRTLFFAAFTGRRLYALDTAALADPSLDDAALAARVRDAGEIGIAGHIVADADGRLYVMSMEQDAIFRRALNGNLETIVANPVLEWPDSMAIGRDQYLYITVSQHDRGPLFHDGQDLRERPFLLFRTFVGAGPQLGSSP